MNIESLLKTYSEGIVELTESASCSEDNIRLVLLDFLDEVGELVRSDEVLSVIHDLR